MFERFTDRSRRVLVLAQEEARLLAHPYIGPEHILLGLVAEGGGAAARALAAAGIELAPAREAVGRIAGSMRAGNSAPPFTPEAKQVLERSLHALLARGGSNMETEHLLFGLLAVESDVVVAVLATFDTDADDLCRRMEEILPAGDRGGPGDRPATAAYGAAYGGTIERFFGCLSARNWAGLGMVLSPEIDRIGPLGDLVHGKANYLELLRESVPEVHGNDIHRITYALGAASAFVWVTEHLGYPDQELHLEEAYFFQIDQRGLITRVEIFWQSHESGPDGR